MSSSPSAGQAAVESAERAAFDFAQLTPAPDAAPPITDAAARARALIAAAEAEAGRIRDAARAQGYQDGVEAARAEASLALRPAVTALDEAVAGMRQLKEDLVADLERQAADFALGAAERIVAGALEVQPERILDVLRGALRTIVERERIVIMVNPDDLDLVRGGLDGLKQSLGGIEHVEVQEERRVARGGAVVRTAVGEIDATLETKMDRARAAVAAEAGG